MVKHKLTLKLKSTTGTVFGTVKYELEEGRYKVAVPPHIVLRANISPIKVKSEKKDSRGKPLYEIKSTVRNNTEKRIERNRSLRLVGIPKTKVIHKVFINRKVVHQDRKA